MILETISYCNYKIIINLNKKKYLIIIKILRIKELLLHKLNLIEFN